MERDHIHESPRRKSFGAFWAASTLGITAYGAPMVGGGHWRRVIRSAYGCGPQIQVDCPDW